jgi:hypothetical protein
MLEGLIIEIRLRRPGPKGHREDIPNKVLKTDAKETSEVQLWLSSRLPQLDRKSTRTLPAYPFAGRACDADLCGPILLIPTAPDSRVTMNPLMD